MGKALGTPGYLPLEAGLVEPNPSFDVFGLGATLYQLLTGTLPEEPLQPLREAHPGCDAPDDLELVLAAALALEPEDRTQTAAELGRALEAVLAAHPERGTPSTRIDGRYELIGLAGTGAKADAYLAVHRGAGHDVVLKFLRSKDPDEVLRFTREAMLLQTFDHPALPRFYDHAPEASPPYIAMAHAPGRPAARLCSPPRLRPAEVAAVGVKLAEVLAVVHARGVLHRDINANNVLIDERGAVTLLDFGAAELDEKFYDVPAGERRYLTPPEARVVIPHGGIGTLAWSAPEVRAGSGWTDKSDVYSMGHLLFRLLTGKVPVKGADPPTSPQVYASACPEDLAAAVMSALQVDPRHRPSAAQLAQTLSDALESEEEALARVRGGGAAPGRPALRLVPAGPQVRADWTEHPIPEATSDPDPQVLPDPPSLPLAAVDAVTRPANLASPRSTSSATTRRGPRASAARSSASASSRPPAVAPSSRSTGHDRIARAAPPRRPGDRHVTAGRSLDLRRGRPAVLRARLRGGSPARHVRRATGAIPVLRAPRLSGPVRQAAQRSRRVPRSVPGPPAPRAGARAPRDAAARPHRRLRAGDVGQAHHQEGPVQGSRTWTAGRRRRSIPSRTPT
jgi:serine/threonine protein kinase